MPSAMSDTCLDEEESRRGYSFSMSSTGNGSGCPRSRGLAPLVSGVKGEPTPLSPPWWLYRTRERRRVCETGTTSKAVLG